VRRSKPPQHRYLSTSHSPIGNRTLSTPPRARSAFCLTFHNNFETGKYGSASRFRADSFAFSKRRRSTCCASTMRRSTPSMRSRHLSGFCLTSDSTCSDQPLTERTIPSSAYRTSRSDRKDHQVHGFRRAFLAIGIRQCSAILQVRMPRRSARRQHCVGTTLRPQFRGQRIDD